MRELALILAIGIGVFSVAFFIVRATEMYLTSNELDVELLAILLAITLFAFGSIQIISPTYRWD